MKYCIPTPMKALEALKNLYPDSSRRTLQNWLEKGRFTVDGEPLKKENTPLNPGQVLSSKETFKPPKTKDFTVLFEDKYLIAIDKPIGLLSVPLDDKKPSRSALGLLRENYNTDQIYAVHRIDRDTSGAIIFARGRESEEKFKVLFELHEITREYFAIVEGKLKEEKGTWESTLLELPSFDVIESDEGRDAITHFEVIRRSQKYTYLKLTLETGRKHQIRVHCRAAGHPVLGDRRYGSNESPIKRLCLHALSLSFIHPFTKKEISFNSPLPAPFKGLCRESLPF